MNPDPKTPECVRRCRSGLAAISVVVALTAAAAADDSLARSVPADLGLFVETRQAQDILTALTDPQLWTTLAELAGQPSQPQDVARWRERIRQTVHMDPDEAIRVLFARGVAFLGEGPGRAQDGVVVCRPAGDVSIDDLLRKWQARRISKPGQPATYRLHHNIGVVRHGELLYFGDLLPARGLLQHIRRFLARGSPRPLADDEAYQRLLARVPKHPSGIAFARTAQAAPLIVPKVRPGSQPSAPPALHPRLPDLPGPLHHARNVMISLHRDKTLLHFTLVGDAPDEQPPPGAGGLAFVTKLPRNTLAAWEGHVDYASLPAAIKALPSGGAWGAVFQVDQQGSVAASLARALATDTCITIGPVSPRHRADGAPPLPAAGVLIATRDAPAADRALRMAVDAGVAGYAMFALAQGVPPLAGVREVRRDATTLHVLDLSPLLKPTARQGIGELQLCWAEHRDALILATHLDWLTALIEAREGRTDTLAGVVRLSRGQLTPQSTTALVVQTGLIADIGRRWLAYLRRVRPEVFEETWWRDRQPGGGDARLGINVALDEAHRRLRIEKVFKGQPAEGHLRVGDYIVGCENRRFATDDLIGEVRSAIRNRPHARWVELLIERNGVTLRKRIPLPFIDPIEGLQRIVAIGRIARRGVYFDDRAGAGSRGFLTIQLRESPAGPHPR